MNKYVLITSMKPVFDCFDAPCRSKLRQTCKWCNKHIRRHLDYAGAQLVIRRAWYYYKLHKNLCVSSPLTTVENLKILMDKSASINPDYITSFAGGPKSIALLYSVKCLKPHSHTYFKSASFENLVKCGLELVIPTFSEEFKRNLDIVKSCYIKLYGNHKNLIIDLVIDSSKWLSASIPDDAIAIRIHFGLLPIYIIAYNTVNVHINYPINLQRRYLHGVTLECSSRNTISNRQTLFLNHKIFVEAFYSDGSRKLIGNPIDSYIVHQGKIYQN
jgi:hypothetical protein